MKVMILTPSFERTSPVQGAVLFARYLRQRGEEVTFSALDSSYRTRHCFLAEIERAGVPVHGFNMNGWAGLRHLKRVRTYMADNGIEAVISYSLRPEIVTSRLSGVMRVSAAREVLREQFASSYRPGLARLLSVLRLHTLKQFDGVFVLTQAMGQHLADNGLDPGKIHQVNNFVDVAEVREAAKHDVHSGGGDEDIHIGYFGLLTRRKRVEIAVQAVGKLLHDYAHKNVRLHIAGDGPLRPSLARLAGELGLGSRMVFYGYLPQPFALMNKMNLIVLPSDAEGLPRCLMEAMSLGKTCLASNIPGMTELIRHGETGYLFQKGNAEELASLMDRIIRFRQYLPAENLHRYMLMHYDVHACAGRMFSKLQEIARHRSQARAECR